MTYTKETWTSTKAINAADLLHMETQVSESLSDLTTHDVTGHPTIYYTKTLMDSYFWNQNNDGSISTLNADKLGGYHASDIISGIQSGFMGWWDARNGAIPSGFLFCDGTSSTLDMRGRFPVGAGTLGVGITGGNSTITPEATATIGGCTLTAAQILHIHSVTQQGTITDPNNGGPGGTMYNGNIANITLRDDPFITSTVGGNTPHTHPGSFVGSSVSMLPLYNYLVVIQKS